MANAVSFEGLTETTMAMTTGIRTTAVVAVVILTGGAAGAQLPVAPRPHPSLKAMVAEYRRLNLPLAPPGAELVRIDWWNKDPLRRPEEQDSFILAFRLPPLKSGAEPRYQTLARTWDLSSVHPDLVAPAAPTVAALQQVSLGDAELLALAVECEIRGWRHLAGAAYLRAREHLEVDEPNFSVFAELRRTAWSLWHSRLTDRTSDRSEILRQLKTLAAEEERLRTPRDQELLRRLELTVAPRVSKPGSVEALIDDLTEHWHEFDVPDNDEGHRAYWTLAELGFDAVPALIDHLNDDRLSRAYSEKWVNNFFPYHLTVGHLASRLLWDLSGRTIGGEYWALRGDRLDPNKARAWFSAAQKVGEEKWLLDQAMPVPSTKSVPNLEGCPERHIVRVLGAKYPGRLPPIYRALLRKPASALLTWYVRGILASKLTREQKIGLFEDGIRHEDFDHVSHALLGLAEVDRPLFRKHLLRILTHLPAPLDEGKLGFDFPDQIVPLVVRAADRCCWGTLAVVTKHTGVEFRTRIISTVGRRSPPETEDPVWKERLRFLVQFLDDHTVEVDSPDESKAEVRDVAAIHLAGLLGFTVKRNVLYQPDYNPNQGPLSRLLLRAAVRQVAERELARPAK